MVKNKRSLETTSKIPKELQDKINVKFEMSPEYMAAKAVAGFGLDCFESLSSPQTIFSEIIESANSLSNGDTSLIVRCLYSQTIMLNAFFEKMLALSLKAEYLNQLQVYSSLALKAQNQSRNTFLTIDAIANPKKITFVKQQNNAINQQVNSAVESKNSKNFSNELLSEMNHEKLDRRGAQEAISIDTQMETVENVDGSKNARGKD